MQAILNIKQSELNSSFLALLKALFEREDIDEITIKRAAASITFEEFDAAMPLQEVIGELKQEGYSAEFLKEIETGLSRLVYSK